MLLEVVAGVGEESTGSVRDERQARSSTKPVVWLGIELIAIL